MNKNLKCPTWLSKTAKAAWRRYVSQINECTVLESVDETALAALCQQVARWEQAEKAIEELGLVINRGRGPAKLNPAARASDSALKQIKGLLIQLGFTPASRGRVKGMKPGGEGEGDAFQQFLQGSINGQNGSSNPPPQAACGIERDTDKGGSEDEGMQLPGPGNAVVASTAKA